MILGGYAILFRVVVRVLEHANVSHISMEAGQQSDSSGVIDIWVHQSISSRYHHQDPVISIWRCMRVTPGVIEVLLHNSHAVLLSEQYPLVCSFPS